MKHQPLSKLADIQTGPFGSQLHKEDYVLIGTPIVTVEHLGNRVFTEQNLPRVKAEDKVRLAKYVLRTGDIVFSRVGSVDRCSYVDERHDGWMFSGRCLRVRPSKEIDPLYLYYYFCREETKQFIRNIAVGATMPSINTKLLGEVEITFPDITEQRKIAELLSAIDDKIELNTAINDNLALQMQAIWSNLFLSGMESGTKVSLGDHLYVKGRIGWKGLKKEEYLSESPYRIINGESLTASGIDWDKAGFISEDRYKESPEIMLQVGDILISKDGTIGKVGYVDRLEKPTSVASGIFVVRNLKPEAVSTIFIYCLLTSSYFKEFIASRTEGSVIPHLYQKDFVTLEIPLLSREQLQLFDNTVTPLFNAYFDNQQENLRLAELRDALLPRLMSGDIAVSDVQI